MTVHCINELFACLLTSSVRKNFLEYSRVMAIAGGNSKTAMVAAISPADINYEETLSTLRQDLHCCCCFA